MADTNQQIVRQVEYYFGDINLPRDKFLQEQLKLDEGWVPLDTMLKFNRLLKISSDTAQIAGALADSNLIELSDDKTKIRRSLDVPMPNNTLEYWQEIKTRTVYVKGFDAENTTLDEIQAFAEQFGDVKNIVMRKTQKEKKFKGSVFVTFATKEGAEKFLKSEAANTFKDQPLEKLMQTEYWLKKTTETKQRRAEQKAVKQAQRLEEMAEVERNKLSSKFVKGVVLEVSGLAGKDIQFTEIKDFFKQFGKVAFAAYEAGEDKARIRFSSEEGAASAAWEKAKAASEDGKVMFKDFELTAAPLEGDAESDYWDAFTKSKIAANLRLAENKRQNNKGNRSGNRGGRGGRGGGRGGRDGGGGDARGPKRPIDTAEATNGEVKEETVDAKRPKDEPAATDATPAVTNAVSAANQHIKFDE